MKKLVFLKNAILFFLLFALVTGGICILGAKEPVRSLLASLTGTEDYLDDSASNEIVEAVLKVKSQPASDKLIIGDSVCNHLFSESAADNPDYLVAATNRGIGMSGQYVLAKLFLSTHPDAKEVNLIITTNTLITGYETQFGYQYATEPFLRTDTLNMMDEESLADMKETYGDFVTNKGAALTVMDSPVLKKLYLNLLNEYKGVGIEAKIPDCVERNILNIASLCRERNVEFHLIAAPVAESSERRELEKKLEKEYDSTGLKDLFPGFYKNMHYYPAEYFSDGIHPDKASGMIPQMIEDLKKDNGVLEDFIVRGWDRS